MVSQLEHIELGTQRLVYYTSCFTENYQDVCANQKKEDTRFMLALVQLAKHWHVVGMMIKIYVDLLLQNTGEDGIQRIQRSLLKRGANIASSSLTNNGFSGAVTAAVSYGFGVRMSLDRKLLKIGTAAVAATGYYGYVQEAADAANRLQRDNGIYYHGLYQAKLEMLYFLIEPIISRNPALVKIRSSEAEITEAIMRMLR